MNLGMTLGALAADSPAGASQQTQRLFCGYTLPDAARVSVRQVYRRAAAADIAGRPGGLEASCSDSEQRRPRAAVKLRFRLEVTVSRPGLADQYNELNECLGELSIGATRRSVFTFLSVFKI